MSITTTISSTATPSSNLDHPARSVIMRRLSAVACVLWLGTAASTLRWWWDSTDDWESWYAVYVILLTSAAGATAAASISTVWNDSRGRMARLGAALTVIAVFSTLAAWALPFWMLLIGIGYGVFAMVVPEHRRHLAPLAVAQLAGVATLFVGESLGVGPSDEWDTHPVAVTAAVMTTSLLTVVALLPNTRRPKQLASAR
jgi:hypothetical protein